jgi:hypothetical protein
MEVVVVAGLVCMLADWTLLIVMVITTACLLALIGALVARGAARLRMRPGYSTRSSA